MIWSSSAAPGDEWAETSIDEWSRVRLAGEVLPGRAEVVGADVGRKIDVKAPPGSGGATITDRGTEPSRFGIKVTIWTEAHLAAWKRIVPKLLTRPRGGLTRWPIYHPALEIQGIREVVVERIGSMQPGSQTGEMTAEIRLIQWMPPKRTNQTKTLKVGDPALTDLDPNAPNFMTADGQQVNRPPPPSKTNTGP